MSPEGMEGGGEKANMNINNETCPSVVSKVSNAQVFLTHSFHLADIYGAKCLLCASCIVIQALGMQQ